MRELSSLGLRHRAGRLEILDQRVLPREERWVDASDPEVMGELIRGLAVRGAPLIGVAAALCLGKLAEGGASSGELRHAGAKLKATRPTAVNLAAAVDRVLASGDPARESERVFDEDVALCEGIARSGEALVPDGAAIYTHCNTGGLATAGSGTALAVIRRAHESGKRIHVYAGETRPLLQGARLTTWELARLGIPHTLVFDGLAAAVLRDRGVKLVIVGADRIARNGDFANKVGTYSLAVLARFHGIPFHPAAPRTTVDLSCPSGREIPIEERDPDEVRGAWAPRGVGVLNPAFDVTPRELVTGLVLDSGVVTREELLAGGLAPALARG